MSDVERIESMEWADREFLVELSRGDTFRWDRSAMPTLSRAGLAELATIKDPRTGASVRVARLTPRGRRALKAWHRRGDPWERRKRANGKDESEQKKSLSAALRRDK